MHPPEPPDHAADPPRPTQPTPTPCEEREAERAPRSTSCTLLVDVEAAGPVTDVIGVVVRLRSAVDEVAGEVLHDVHRLAAGHRLCSAGCDKVSG